MKQKFLTVLLITMIMFVLSGCVHAEQAITVSSDEKITVAVKQSYEKAATDEALNEIFASDENTLMPDELNTIKEILNTYPVETVDGVECYIIEDSMTYTAEEFVQNFPTMIATKDKFYCYFGIDDTVGEDFSDLASDDEISEYLPNPEDISFKVTLPSPIVHTNGTVPDEDNHTASWSLSTDTFKKNDDLYAYTANDPANREADRATVEEQIKAATSIPSPTPNVTQTSTPTVTDSPTTTESKDKKAPTIKGIKKNKTYKKKVTVYVRDNVKLQKVTVNGKKVALTKVKSGKYKGYYKFTVKKKGKKKIVAIDTSKNKKTITIKIK